MMGTCSRCQRDAHEKCLDRGIDDDVARVCECRCWHRPIQTPFDRSVRVAELFERFIAELDAEVVTLMKSHASVKAMGPAHTARYVEELASMLMGPLWRETLLCERERVS